VPAEGWSADEPGLSGLGDTLGRRQPLGAEDVPRPPGTP